MDVGNIDEREAFTTLDGSTIREIAGRLTLPSRNQSLAEATVPPGGFVDLVCGFPPVTKPGSYLVHADLIDAQPIEILSADFVQYGSEPIVFGLTVK